MALNLLNHNPLRTVGDNREYLYRNGFQIDGTNDPDNIDQDDGETTFARTGAGTFTVTFPGNKKPAELHFFAATLDDAGHDASAAYVASTGVLTITVTDGTSAADPADDTLVKFMCIFSR